MAVQYPLCMCMWILRDWLTCSTWDEPAPPPPKSPPRKPPPPPPPAGATSTNWEAFTSLAASSTRSAAYINRIQHNFWMGWGAGSVSQMACMRLELRAHVDDHPPVHPCAACRFHHPMQPRPWRPSCASQQRISASRLPHPDWGTLMFARWGRPPGSWLTWAWLPRWSPRWQGRAP